MRSRRTPLALLTALSASSLLAPHTRADEGMWLLNNPPVKLLRERYGFEPSPSWLEHLQKSAVRMGASGSLVSPDGLLMTNHHVASDALDKLSTADRNLLRDGYYAKTRADELKVPDMEVSVLWTIEDVTDKVNAAAASAKSPAEANAARRKAMTTIEQEAKDSTGLRAQIVTLYSGARYHLYSYKRFNDVRVVFAPEQAAAFFGGDTDNFEYPRYCLDMTFFRIYENDQPLKPEHYLSWSKAGASEGELTFVIGHPGRTRRLYTADHLRFLRDVAFPLGLERIWRTEIKYQTFAGRNAENARIVHDDLLGVENGRKRNTGQLSGLLDPAVFNSKLVAEATLREAVNHNPEWKSQWASAWDDLASAMHTYGDFYVRSTVLSSMSGGSRLFSIAQTLVRLADEKPKSNAERLREYSDAALDSLMNRLLTTAPIYDELEIMKLESGLLWAAEKLGGEDPTVLKALNGLSPRARAEQLVRNSSLIDVDARKALADGGKQAIDASNDPLIALAKLLDPELREYRKRSEDTVDAVERDAYAKIAAAQFALYGESIYPDATGTLRLAFGPVKGWEEGGHTIPPFTTIAGLYERAQERAGQKNFDLPDSWIKAKPSLDLSTPYNFVSTADIIGGNSGSPVVNVQGEVVGLIFDGNLHSLSTDIAFNDQLSRAVSVDSRAIIEALRKVYHADALADELVGASRN